MYKTVVALILSCAATVFTNGAFAANNEIVVSDATVRAVPPGTTNTAVFLTITNNSTADRKLVKASSPVAKTVELHTHTSDNGVMKMRQVRDVPVKAKGQTELKTGGYHIMLIDLKQPPKEGEIVSVTLTFDDGSTQEISAPVAKIQATMPMNMEMDHGKMKH